jgi:plasmid stability protein
MKNITVSVEEAVHHRARIRAAERGTSLSALVRDFLISLSANTSPAVDPRRLAQEELFRRLDAQARGLAAEDRLDRSDLHQRQL